MKMKLMLLSLMLAMSCALSSAKDSDALFARFESRFQLLDSLIYKPQAASAVAADSLPNQSFASDWKNLDDAIDQRVDARIAQMRSVTGLSSTGQIYGRLDEGFGLDEEDALSRYKAKIQADIRWNFLQSSLFKRKGREQEIRLQGDIDKILYRRENLDRLVAIQKDIARQRYDSLIYGVLTLRIENLQLLSNSQSYLLEKGGISSDDLFNVLDTKAEAERQREAISGIFPMAADLSNPGATTITIDTAAMLGYVRENNDRARLLELRRQLADQKAANTSYWSTLNVSPFVRYSYYMRPDIKNSSNVDAGISFIIPINNTESHKRKALKAESNVLALEQSLAADLLSDELKLQFLEIERLNRSIIGEVRRLKELKGYLELRKKAYDNRIGQYNYLSRLREYNSYLQCCEQLLTLTYRRDVLLAALQSFVPDVSIFDFCHIKEENLSNH